MPSGFIKYYYYPVIAIMIGELFQKLIHCFGIAVWAYHRVGHEALLKAVELYQIINKN